MCSRVACQTLTLDLRLIAKTLEEQKLLRNILAAIYALEGAADKGYVNFDDNTTDIEYCNDMNCGSPY